MSMQWQYIRKGSINDETVGPVSAKDLQELFFAKKIDGKTMVLHPAQTENQWRPLKSAAIYETLTHNLQAVRLKAAQQKQAEQQQKEMEAKARQEQLDQERAVREDARRQEQELARRESRQLKTRIGADRWPNMFRCAKVYEIVAIFMAVLVGVNLLAIAAWPLMGGLASIASGGAMGFALGAMFLLLAIMVVAAGGVLGYLLYTSMRCWAEMLRCFAAIEANTRTMWNQSDKDSGSPNLEV